MRIACCTLFLFSMFFVSLGQAIPLPDYYSEGGAHLGRSQDSQSVVEHVDPFSGVLLRVYDDINIPGNGGIGLSVKRTYRSQQNAPGMLLPPHSIAGYGWDVHFGRIWNYVANSYVCGTGQYEATNNFILELANGEKKVLYETNNTFITKDRWVGTCAAYDDISIKDTSGTTYRFNRVGKIDRQRVLLPTSIRDKYGNTITINYYSESTNARHTLIQSVTLNAGGAVSFSYFDIGAESVRLRTISGSGQSATYAYGTALGPGNRHYLAKVSRNDGAWSYTYNTATNDDGNYTYPGKYLLRRATHPVKGASEYQYSNVAFDPGQYAMDNTVISQITRNGTQVWRYSYSPSSTYDVTEITGPGYRERVEHFGSRSGSNGNVWRVGLIHSRALFTGSTQTQRENFTWTSQTIANQVEYNRRSVTRGRDGVISAPVLGARQVLRDGTSYSTSYSSFDNYGYPRTINETGNDFRQKQITYYSNTSLNIVGVPRTERVVSASIHGDAIITRGMNGQGDPTTVDEYGLTRSISYYPSGAISRIEDARGVFSQFKDYYRGVPRLEETGIGGATYFVVNRTVSTLGFIESESLPAINVDPEEHWPSGVVGLTRSAGWNLNAGSATQYRYDSSGRLTHIGTARSDDSNIDISYSGRSRTLTRGSYAEVRLFDWNGLVENVSAHGITVGYLNDALGRRTFESYPNKQYPEGIRYTYDVLGRVTSKTFVDNTTEEYSYLQGNIVRVKDNRGNVTRYTYRSYGNPDEKYLIKIEAPEGVVIDIQRDKLGNIWSAAQRNTDGRLYTRTYHRDSRFLVAYVEEPEMGTGSAPGRRNYTYNPSGLKATEQYDGEQPARFFYTAQNKLASIIYPDATPDIYYSYDGRGNLLRVITVAKQANGGLVLETDRLFVYDANGNLSSEKLAYRNASGTYQQYELAYEYNNNDAIRAIRYPDGWIVSYDPDDLARPTRVSPFVDSVDYFPNQKPSRIMFANGTATTYALDARENVSQINWAINENETISDYSYDPNGNMISASEFGALQYDGLNRIVFQNTDPQTPENVARVASYDRLGNIEFRKDLVLVDQLSPRFEYEYDRNKNRLLRVTGHDAQGNAVALRQFLYDARGNVTNNGKNSFTYDMRNLLKSVDSGKVSYTYDGLGNRVCEVGANAYARCSFYSKSGQKVFEADSVLGTRSAFAYLGALLVGKRQYCVTAGRCASP